MTSNVVLLNAEEVKYLMSLVNFDSRTNHSFLRNTAPDQFPNQRKEASSHMELAESVLSKLKPPS